MPSPSKYRLHKIHQLWICQTLRCRWLLTLQQDNALGESLKREQGPYEDCSIGSKIQKTTETLQRPREKALM